MSFAGAWPGPCPALCPGAHGWILSNPRRGVVSLLPTPLLPLYLPSTCLGQHWDTKAKLYPQHLTTLREHEQENSHDRVGAGCGGSPKRLGVGPQWT